MAKVQKLPFPCWLVVPDLAPSNPIVLPPEVAGPDDPRPSHPIFLPEAPVYPDNSLPGDQPVVEHPIYLPVGPDNTLPGDQPIVDNSLPSDQPGIDNTLPPFVDNSLPGDQPVIDNSLPPLQPRPEHPIYDPVYPDNSLPPEAGKVGDLDFYQRKTVGINWDPDALVPSMMVGVYVKENGSFTKVRTVPNNGASSVTYPADYTGTATFRVSGINGYCEGTVKVT
jgi:hypothetical protein